VQVSSDIAFISEGVRHRFIGPTSIAKFLYGSETAYRFSIHKSVDFRSCVGYMKTLAPLQLPNSFMGGKRLTGFYRGIVSLRVDC
jgi:hypothetical protein